MALLDYLMKRQKITSEKKNQNDVELIKIIQDMFMDLGVKRDLFLNLQALL